MYYFKFVAQCCFRWNLSHVFTVSLAQVKGRWCGRHNASSAFIQHCWKWLPKVKTEQRTIDPFLWGSDMIYHDFNINFFLSPYVCDLNAAWCLLKQATRLRGPELGQDRQWIPWGFFKSISARCLLLWCLDLFFSLCFCLVSLYVYLCSYVFVCVCWYLFTGTCVMACKRSRLRWWNRFGNRCHVKLPMWRDVFV